MKTIAKLFNKLMYAINILVALLLLIGYVLPYLPPQKFATLSVLSLAVPMLILLNVGFAVYWLIGLKRKVFLSVLVLLLGYNYINRLYKLPSEANENIASDFSVMTYNVRLFNLYGWLPNAKTKSQILNLFEAQQPDVLCIQEYHEKDSISLKNYTKYTHLANGKIKSGQAIFSKLPIINKGLVEFNNSSNNAIFVDVLVKNDTVRVYNIHLQSNRISANLVAQFKKETSEDLFKRVRHTFKTQQLQAEQLIKHMEACQHKTIIMGDFNNTAFSYVYNAIKGNFNDAFVAKGKGFGRTYDFKLFPVRIDFILADPKLKVNTFTTFKNQLSDHFPIKASLSLD